jgi:hypothetical protein
MKRFRNVLSQSPAIIISLIALTFSLGGGAGYAASAATNQAAAARITWHPLSLRNGWRPAGGSTGGPAYGVLAGVVYLTGVVTRSNNPKTLPAVGVLPGAARPKHNLYFAGYNYTNVGVVSVEVTSGGDIYVEGGGDSYFFSSLAGISFPLGS